MIVTILQWNTSNGAATLAKKLRENIPGLKVGLAKIAETRRCQGTRLVINWGNRHPIQHLHQDRLIISNPPEAVGRCINKIETLRALQAANVPSVVWSTNAQELRTHFPRHRIVARTIVNGSSGAGIRIIQPGEPIVPAPLYTIYFKKQAEFRLHVAFGRVILIQQKRRRLDHGETEEGSNANLVRTHDNGWVFTIQNLSCDQNPQYRAQLEQIGLQAAQAVGANHCAVDVLVNDRREIVVCEINSAPGIEADSTEGAYVEAFSEYIRQQIAQDLPVPRMRVQPRPIPVQANPRPQPRTPNRPARQNPVVRPRNEPENTTTPTRNRRRVARRTTITGRRVQPRRAR